MASSIPAHPEYIFQAALLTLLSLEQTDKVPTPTERPRQGSDILTGTTPQGHAPWLHALLRKTPEDDQGGHRPLPWLLPSLTERVAEITWVSANNNITIKHNRTLAFCPGSILGGEVKPFLVGAMSPSSSLCRTILLSIANPRVFHSVLHTGSDTGKEYGLHTFPRNILRQLEKSPTAKWLVPFTLPPLRRGDERR